MVDKVYICWLELNGDSASLISRGVKGAVLICSVLERSLKSALESVENALQEDGYIISEFESITLFNPEEVYDAEIMELVNSATKVSEVNYGLFRAWDDI